MVILLDTQIGQLESHLRRPYFLGFLVVQNRTTEPWHDNKTIRTDNGNTIAQSPPYSTHLHYRKKKNVITNRKNHLKKQTKIVGCFLNKMSRKPRKSLRYGSTKSSCKSCFLNSTVQNGLQSSSKLVQHTSNVISKPFKYQKKKKSYKNVYITITTVLVLTAVALLLYFLTASE